jgi:hypothetical protein
MLAPEPVELVEVVEPEPAEPVEPPGAGVNSRFIRNCSHDPRKPVSSVMIRDFRSRSIGSVTRFLIQWLVWSLRALFRTRGALAIENIALRQQLTVSCAIGSISQFTSPAPASKAASGSH